MAYPPDLCIETLRFNRKAVLRPGSVLVVVFAVGRMPTSVVDVIDMVAVWDRDMAAALAMDVVVLLVHLMT